MVLYKYSLILSFMVLYKYYNTFIPFKKIQSFCRLNTFYVLLYLVTKSQQRKLVTLFSCGIFTHSIIHFYTKLLLYAMCLSANLMVLINRGRVGVQISVITGCPAKLVPLLFSQMPKLNKKQIIKHFLFLMKFEI